MTSNRFERRYPADILNLEKALHLIQISRKVVERYRQDMVYQPQPEDFSILTDIIMDAHDVSALAAELETILRKRT